MNTETGLTVTYRGTKYPVTINDFGRFQVLIEGHDVQSDRYADLDAQVQKIPRKKIAVPVIRVRRSNNEADNPEIRHGTITGRHIDGRTLLIRWADGETGQVRSYNVNDYLPALTEAQEMELMARLEIEQAAGIKVTELLDGYRSLPGVETLVIAALEADDGQA